MARTQIKTPGIANDAVTAAQIAAGAVGTTEIANDAVTTAKIAAGAVGTTEIDSGVTITGTLNGNASTVTNGVYTGRFLNDFSGSRGYQKFPGGFIIQWGQSSRQLGQEDEFQTFATRFPGGVFSVQVTPNGGGNNPGDKRDHWLAISWQNDGFTLRSRFENGGASYSWVAFGA